ncbi:MAG: class I SAM-dependent methyltransferase [Candidatus Bathyarchaeota archaeon]|nr:class I SAM-dependent methyltransferase [Candidatus Bathyarchaeota archaeon]MDH5788017.1 class I SAM-dependent methyltransferase [Candidatus Bathyarchaeota archaeon]
MRTKALNPEEDAYGQEIWACYQGREVFEIVERDDGYIDPSALGPKIYFSKYEDWAPYHRRAMDFVKGKVLDVGCGAGRHSLYLQKKGFDVLGIDNSPLAIKVSKLRGLKKAKVMSIENIGYRPDSFDTIIMMGNNFGLFGSFKKAQELLKKFHKMTSKNALIIADTLDPYKTDNPDHLEYHKHNKKKGRMGGQVRIRIRFRRYVGRWFDYLMVSKEEMKELLKGTGWKVKEFIDSEGPPYIAIIEKVT